MPFFVPVYLWRLGLDLAGLCLLLGVSGLAFSTALGPWQRMARGGPFRRLVGVTFALEIALVVSVVVAGQLLVDDVSATNVTDGIDTATLADPAPTGTALLLAALLVGLVNGAYNAFFWTTQRTLFATLGTERDSGRRYGNLQIVVAVFLKIGILAGGVLVDTDRLGAALVLSAAVALITTLWLARDAGDAPLTAEPPTGWRESLAFRDGARSASVFAVDGPFLYLESHFWTLSLFLLVREDSARLGVVVVALAVLFALLFLLVKNRIDRSAADVVYRTSVALYALSWLLRVAVDEAAPAAVTLALLVAVTFCSSLFRLAFNKRFFDIASGGTAVPLALGGGHESGRNGGGGGGVGKDVDDGTGTGPQPVAYLIAKSHVSQLWIALVFLPLALVLHASDGTLSPEATLDALYVVAAMLALLYLRYRRPAPSAVSP